MGGGGGGGGEGFLKKKSPEACHMGWIVFVQILFEKKSTVKPVSVLSGHSKIDKTKILLTNGSSMKVKSNAESEFS